MTTTDLTPWVRECLNFQEWYKNLGGDTSNTKQMTEAYIRIEPKNLELADPLQKFLA